jgi:hypothetical protein
VANGVDKLGWKVIGGLSAVIASSVARKAVEGAYKGATGRIPPENPEDPDVDLREAVVWAIITGVSVGLARLLVSRAAAGAWVKVRGELPPGLEKDDQQLDS